MIMADRYVFPAVLTYEEGYEIAVTFPDLPGCATSGEDDAEALAMGKEALGLHLWGMELDGDDIPSPSKIKDIELEDGEVIAMVEVYMPSVRLAQENKSVNRTVTLPAWLNARALEQGVNFSQVLQDALKKGMGITTG
ncbi:MAG: type II toxin-antitoxin system HicB family antitoxin [Ruminococcaceae bacterium]|nr:type II toxin-antitoxin system HicB family antitoxin [Oscillospiraceae bacterium]